jgi:hypothetical protein
MSKTYNPSTHLSFMEGKVGSSLTGDPKVEPGNVISFTYQAKTGDGVDKEPLVLITNLNYQGELHGINMNYMTRVQVKALAAKFGMYKRYNMKNAMIEAYDKNYPMVRLQVRDTKGFYTGMIRPTLSSLLDSPQVAYRTYDIKRIGNLQLIDYDWGGVDRGFRNQVIAWEREDVLKSGKDAQVGKGITQAEADKESRDY